MTPQHFQISQELIAKSIPLHTPLPTAEILSGKNARAWVSMVLNLKINENENTNFEGNF